MNTDLRLKEPVRVRRAAGRAGASNFFERRMPADHVSATGTVPFDEDF